MVAIPLILLAATVTIFSTVSEDVFARERYSGDSTSQAAAVSNDCLNPILDSNTIDNIVGVGNCGGTISQMDESGQASAPITSQTANPTIELQRSTTTLPPGLGGQPTTCEDCFNVLNSAQQAAFEAQLPIQVRGDITTIEELCAFLTHLHNIDPDEIPTAIGDVDSSLEFAGIGESIVESITICLNQVFPTS